MTEQTIEKVEPAAVPASLTDKVSAIIHDPFGSVIAAVVLISASSGLVYFGINALGSVA